MLGWALAPSHHIYGWERDEEAYFVNGSVVRQEVLQSLGVEVVVGGVPGHVVVDPKETGRRRVSCPPFS